jgi:hypothetical protein
MTTTNYHRQAPGYRVIQEWPAYKMNAAADVWSLPRLVRGKGGSTRQLAAKQLKVSRCGRVWLSQGGRTALFHVYKQLLPRVFPELFERPQAMCHNGHPLRTPVNPAVFGSLAEMITPNVSLWGTGNRICLWCSNPPATFPDDNTYSLQYGVAGMPEYNTSLRAQPKTFGRREGDGDRVQLADAEWTARGFIISNSPWV